MGSEMCIRDRVRRVRFDRSADRGVQEYRNADGDQREERRSRSTERRDWEADPNCELRADHVGPEGAGFPAARVLKISAHPKTLAHRATARVMVRHRTMAKCRIIARPRTTVRYRLMSHKTMLHRISRSQRHITAHNKCRIMDHRMLYSID